MLVEEIKQLNKSPKELRKFGLLVGGVFVLLGLWFWWRQKGFYLYLLTPGIVLMVLGAIWARALKPVYVVWMALALALGLVVSTLLLVLFFYAVVTPVGLLARLFGKDFLNRRFRKSQPSYWIARDSSLPKKESYEQQY